MASFDILLFYGITSFVISIITVTGNGLNLCVFFHERSLRVNPSNNFIIALTFNDFLYGIWVFIFLGIPYTFLDEYPYGEHGCKAAVCINYLFVVGNMLLLAVSVDRVLMVSLQYSRYVKFQTVSRTKLQIGLCYLAGIILAICEVGLWEHAKSDPTVAARLNFDQYCLSPPKRIKEFGLLVSFGFYVLPVLLIFGLNVVFFILLIRKIKSRGQVGTSTVSTVRTDSVSTTENQEENTKSRYIKPAITLGVLVGAMAISNIPYCVYITVVQFCTRCSDPIVVRICALIQQFNSLLDPLFYGLTQTKIREFYHKKTRRFLELLK